MTSKTAIKKLVRRGEIKLIKKDFFYLFSVFFCCGHIHTDTIVNEKSGKILKAHLIINLMKPSESIPVVISPHFFGIIFLPDAPDYALCKAL